MCKNCVYQPGDIARNTSVMVRQTELLNGQIEQTLLHLPNEHKTSKQPTNQSKSINQSNNVLSSKI